MTVSHATEVPTPSDDAQAVARSIVSVFPTPVVNYHWPDSQALNAALAELVCAAALNRPSLTRSNVGGWHSSDDFLNWDLPPNRELRARLQRFVVQLTKLVLAPEVQGRQARFDLSAWANLMRRGDYHSAHCHPGAFWSGVYYVTDSAPTSEHPMSGKLELMDPRSAAGTLDAQGTHLHGKYLLSPQAGQMLIFPSWMMHCVHPYFGHAPRISIAFNVGFSLAPVSAAP